jgi:chemotaxis protein methyltransferase CheR
MRRADFAAFFSAVAPALALRLSGYGRTRGSVEKRLGRRLRQLGLTSLAEYRTYLGAHADEWVWLDACCRITISRFWRDARVFDGLAATFLPALAAAARAHGQRRLRLWSAGCASGEEAYSLALIAEVDLRPAFPELAIEVLGTDVDPVVLARAERAVYSESVLRELPERYRELAFERRAATSWLAPRYRAAVRFEQADLRREFPEGPFDLVCCRNLALTYFDEPLQRRLVRGFVEVLRPAGVLVVGQGEELPDGPIGLSPAGPCVYVRAADPLDVPGGSS